MENYIVMEIFSAMKITGLGISTKEIQVKSREAETITFLLHDRKEL